MISFPRVLSLRCCVSFFSHDFFLLVARPCVGLPPPRGLGLLITKMPPTGTARVKPLILAILWWRVPR